MPASVYRLVYDNLAYIGIGLIVAGFLALVAFSLLSVPPGQSSNSTKVGGVIVIGFLPIVIGNSSTAIFLAIAIAVVIIVLILIYLYFISRSAR